MRIAWTLTGLRRDEVCTPHIRTVAWWVSPVRRGDAKSKIRIRISDLAAGSVARTAAAGTCVYVHLHTPCPDAPGRTSARLCPAPRGPVRHPRSACQRTHGHARRALAPPRRGAAGRAGTTPGDRQGRTHIGENRAPNKSKEHCELQTNKSSRNLGSCADPRLQALRDQPRIPVFLGNPFSGL